MFSKDFSEYRKRPGGLQQVLIAAVTLIAVAVVIFLSKGSRPESGPVPVNGGKAIIRFKNML